LIGDTGVGKSTLMNALIAGSQAMEIEKVQRIGLRGPYMHERIIIRKDKLIRDR
jgi:putative ribosome biogenesis GTPase RsgA